MADTIQPLDIIRLTQKVKATLIIHFQAPYTDAIEIDIIPETLLLSSVTNFDAANEYAFLPKDGEDHHSILELYKYEIPEGASLDCSFKVSAVDILGKYEIIEPFNYNSLSPDSNRHILFLANLYFYGEMQKVSTEIWNSFISDFTPLQKIITEYKDILITSNETINAIAIEIQKQVYLVRSTNTENKFPAILGKIDLSSDDMLKQ